MLLSIGNSMKVALSPNGPFELGHVDRASITLLALFGLVCLAPVLLFVPVIVKAAMRRMLLRESLVDLDVEIATSTHGGSEEERAKARTDQALQNVVAHTGTRGADARCCLCLEEHGQEDRVVRVSVSCLRGGGDFDRADGRLVKLGVHMRTWFTCPACSASAHVDCVCSSIASGHTCCPVCRAPL